MTSPIKLSSLLERFFTERLMHEKKVSPHTIASYRDTFRQLILFSSEQLKKQPSQMLFKDLDYDLVAVFLKHLEKNRKIGARSRNQRLAAIRSFFKYVSFEYPEHGALIDRVLAIPIKRYDRALVQFLTLQEIEALLKIPDVKTWLGRRDHALLLTAIQTGLRVSELIGLRQKDVVLGRGAHVRCWGKGRKERCTPLTRTTAKVIGSWIKEIATSPEAPVFPSSRSGGHLSPDSVQYCLDKYVPIASKNCVSLKNRNISPHSLRHTAAIQLLQSGVDRSVIALWLGHESTDTVDIYLNADLELKEKVMKKTAPIKTKPGRFKPTDELLAFLENL